VSELFERRITKQLTMARWN